MRKLLDHILKERTPEGRIFSQGRVYLLWSVVAYYATLGIITYKSMKPDATIDLDPLKLIIDALQWAMMLFAGYVFGSKGLDVVKLLMNRAATPATPKDITPPTQPTPQPPTPPEPEI